MFKFIFSGLLSTRVCRTSRADGRQVLRRLLTETDMWNFYLQPIRMTAVVFAKHMRGSRRPRINDVALMSQWLVHTTNYGTLATLDAEDGSPVG